MTQDEIIEIARHIATTLGSRMCDENGDTHGEKLYVMSIDEIVEAIELVAAKEREACAKVCETHGVHVALNIWNGGPDWYKHGKDCAKAIRARGEQG